MAEEPVRGASHSNRRLLLVWIAVIAVVAALIIAFILADTPRDDPADPQEPGQQPGQQNEQTPSPEASTSDLMLPEDAIALPLPEDTYGIQTGREGDIGGGV